MKRALLFFVSLLLPVLTSAQGVGSITVADGAARVIRGTAVMRVAEGMSVVRGDMLETPENGFMQVEFSGGTIVASGPSTRLFVSGRAAASDQLVLMTGWLKCENSADGNAYRIAAPSLAVSTGKGSGAVLLRVTPDKTEIFLESGTFLINEVRADGGYGRVIEVKAGQFLARPRSAKSTETLARPSRAFLDAMPAPFRDTLPSRLDRFAGKAKIEPKADHEVSYAEIQPWLTMQRAWRKGFTERFKPRLKDPEFRKALASHLQEYPEWEPVLYPERFEEKENSEPARSSDSARPRN
jgi:hypothetical protein